MNYSNLSAYLGACLTNKSLDAVVRLVSLTATNKNEAGSWLHAFPLSAIDDVVISLATDLHLGEPICSPCPCVQCGAPVNQLGTHELNCRKNQDCHSRHAAIKKVIQISLGFAKIPPHLESVGLYHVDGKCPVGVTIMPCKKGKVLVWDATCLDVFSPSMWV